MNSSQVDILIVLLYVSLNDQNLSLKVCSSQIKIEVTIAEMFPFVFAEKLYLHILGYVCRKVQILWSARR